MLSRRTVYQHVVEKPQKEKGIAGVGFAFSTGKVIGRGADCSIEICFSACASTGWQPCSRYRQERSTWRTRFGISFEKVVVLEEGLDTEEIIEVDGGAGVRVRDTSEKS